MNKKPERLQGIYLLSFYSELWYVGSSENIASRLNYYLNLSAGLISPQGRLVEWWIAQGNPFTLQMLDHYTGKAYKSDQYSREETYYRRICVKRPHKSLNMVSPIEGLNYSKAGARDIATRITKECGIPDQGRHTEPHLLARFNEARDRTNFILGEPEVTGSRDTPCKATGVPKAA